MSVSAGAPVRVAVLDFGMGNLRSVAKALERAGAAVDVVTEVPDISSPGRAARVDALVVPGQGHFGACLANLGGRAERIREWIDGGRPFLGICLGLQVLFDSSEEAPAEGLGVFAGPVRRFPARSVPAGESSQLKVPHIGWNEVMPRGDQPIFAGIEPGTRFYFVHSYYPVPADPSVIAATTQYGDEICCAAARDTVVATQFHPEKSGEPGIALLRNFLSIARSAA